MEVKFQQRTLSLEEAVKFVNLAVEMCFDTNGEFIPVMQEICEYVATLALFSDYDPLAEDADFSVTYDLVYQYHKEIENIIYDDGNQMSDLRHTIWGIIERRLKPYTIGQAVADYFQGKTSPMIAGIIETLRGELATSDSEETIEG